MNRARRFPIIALTTFFTVIALAQQGDDLVPWLDIPSSWQRSVEEGVVSLVPSDLPSQSSFLMLVEPVSTTDESVEASYARALTDLGPWKPVGEPQQVSLDNGWAFRYGIGVADLYGEKYTAETAVARYGNQLVRFWVLADSDATFNRYKPQIGTAIESVQDSTAAPTGGTAVANVTMTSSLESSFGKGDSGVYLGIERGLGAGAGFGAGSQQTYNQSTGQFETSMTGTAPGVQLSVSDYKELDILFPDGSYRRSLPARGLASDMAWDRANFPIWWGNWSRNGDYIVTDRGGYRSIYEKRGNELISERDRPWVKLPQYGGGQFLAGSFARADYRDNSAPRIVFYADGRYEDRGDFLRMVGSAFNLVVPDGDTMVSRWTDDEARRAMGGGSGTYTVSDYTLTFRDRDGRVWQFGFYLAPGADSAAPEEITINTYRLLRD